VDLDFHPDAPPNQIVWNDPYPELPAVDAPLEEIFASISSSLKKIDQIPLVELGNDMRTAVQNLNQILVEVKSTMKTINTGVTPRAIEAIDQSIKTMASIEKTMGSDSPISQETRNAMKELSDAARAIRVLVDYLERHPDSLIYGKGQNK
jgi:paraquat-inducible protein B